MKYIELQKKNGIAVLMLKKGKVNSLNDEVIDQVREVLRSLENDSNIKSVIITGAGRFFSFGFDIPEFLSFKKERFIEYLVNFTGLYRYIFSYSKPIIAALNGHTIAGGCMLALACDFRIMASGKAKISLNEIGFGSSVFYGAVEMLKYWVGSAYATEILFSGAMYSAEEAKGLGLVHVTSDEESIMEAAYKAANDYATKDIQAFSSIKSLLRKNIINEMAQHEIDSILEFSEIWYSEATWKNLKNITIY